MIVVIDNYDSFVHNLARYIRELGFSTQVYRNDQLMIKDIQNLSPSHIILSPGPCSPNEAGITLPVIQAFYQTTPILGVCLGHQAIGQAFGGVVTRAKQPMHGKASLINHQDTGVFQGLPQPLKVARYHSLIVQSENFPDCLTVTATCSQGEVMGLQHKDYPTHGVQFHPESVLTDKGYQLLENFLHG